jgi:hypothetical protein
MGVLFQGKNFPLLSATLPRRRVRRQPFKGEIARSRRSDRPGGLSYLCQNAIAHAAINQSTDHIAAEKVVREA